MFFLRKNKESAKKTKTAKQDTLERLIKEFEESKTSKDFSFNIAVKMFNRIESAAKSEDELLQFCLEDVIFSSLYATIYEELIITCQANMDVAVKLINKFQEGSEEREQKIATQTQQHLAFLERGGECDGCSCCDHHSDVAELLQAYLNQDTTFFIQLYMGMQTIQLTFEQIIYDIATRDISIFKEITKDDILKFREYIYAYTEAQLR